MKQELHILPSEEKSTAGEDEEEGEKGSKKVSNVGGERQRRLGSNLAGKVTNGSGLEAKSAAPDLEKPEKGVVSSEKHALASDGNQCSAGDSNEAPKSLAEELGAPGEDIENLLVEQPPTELPKKESVTTSVASAVIIHTDSTSKNPAEGVVKESSSASKSDKYSPSKKLRNYRQRSKSTSESRKKRKEASSPGKTSKPDSKKSTVGKKESHRRKSERSSSRSKEQPKSKVDASENSKRKTDNAKEKDKAVTRNRSVKRGRTDETDRSKERKENATAARKQRSKHSSSGSSSSGSSLDEPRTKASRPISQKQDKLPTSGGIKCFVAKRESTESKKNEKDADLLKMKNFNTTFGSELKKVKQLTEKDPIAASKTSRNDVPGTILKLDMTGVSNEAVKEISLPEPERPSLGNQSLVSKPSETPKPQTHQSETSKPKIDTPSVPEYPTHSPLKTPALYKNVNPSLLPVDHENLTFKITSAFQAAPTPPNLPPVYTTLSNVAQMPSTENTDETIHGIKSTTETAPKPETIDLTTDATNTVASSPVEKRPSAPSNPLNTKTA